jgi:hypothetical protein
LSRIRIFMLLATAVALAGAFTACGGGSDSSGEDPKTVIENATLEGVESGTLDLALGISSEGDGAGNVDVSLSGPFQSRGAEALPELGFEVSAKGDIDGEAIDFDGDLTLLSDRAFIGYEGTDYEVDPTTFGFVKSGFEQGLAEGGNGGSADPTACQEAAAAIDLTSVFENLENEGSADVDGTSTTKVSGDVNPEGAIDAIIALTEDPACSSTLEAAGPLPLDDLEAAKGEVSDALKKAHAEVYVGDDEIIRKVVAELTIEPKGSGEKVEMNFELTLGAVNEKQEISAPANAEPLEGLFKQLGVDPLALLEGASSGEGLGGLLEGLEGGGGSSGGGGEVDIPDELPDAEASTEYLDCLGEAKSASDLQKCASLIE